MFSKCFILTLFHNHFINKNISFELSLKSQQAWPRFRTQGQRETRMSIVDSSGFGLEGTVQRGYYIHNIQQDSLRILKGFYRHYTKWKKYNKIYKCNQTARWKKCDWNSVGFISKSWHCCSHIQIKFKPFSKCFFWLINWSRHSPFGWSPWHNINKRYS